MRLYIRIFTFSFFLLLTKGANSLFAQNYLVNIEFYNSENGLSGNFANCTFKDSRGIIWIGTQFGLNRFDGRDFLIFDEASGLPFPQVMEIHEDSEGWLWLFRTCYNKEGCIKDLAFLHSITHEIHTFDDHFGRQFDFEPQEISSILTNSSGDVFMSTKQDVFRWRNGQMDKKIEIEEVEGELKILDYTKSNKLVGWYNAQDKDEKELIRTLVFDLQGNISNRQTLQDPTGIQSFHSLILKGQDYLGQKVAGVEGVSVPNIAQYIISDEGKLTLDSRPMKEYSYCFFNPYQSTHWNSSKEGIKIYNLSDNSEYALKDDFPENELEWVVRQIMFDERDVTWIAGRYGVHRIQLRTNKFQRILYQQPSAVNSSSRYICRGVIPIAENRLLLGTMNNVVGDLFETTIQKPDSVFQPSGIEFVNENFKTLSKGHQNELWGMALNNTFYRIKYSKSNYQAQKVNTSVPFDFPTILSQFYEENHLWMGTDKGLYFYDHVREHFFEFEGYNEFDELRENVVNQIFEESKGNFWLCASSGLYRFSLQNGITNRYWEGGIGDFKIPGKSFYHITPAQHGGWWLASKEGLIFWDPDNNITQHYTTADGLIANEILSVHEDNYGFLWLATNYGLIQFQISTGLSKVWLEKEGICSNDLEPHSYFAQEDGTVWFGSTNGFTVFHPKDFKDFNFNKRPDVPLNILEFEQFSEESNALENRTKELLDNGKITLKTGEQIFNLRVGLTDYVNGNDAKYAYQIKGVQDFWQESKENLIRISGLPYGSFTLSIKGRLANGQYSSKEINLPIHVLRPFYLKFWFFLLIGILLFLGFYSIVRYRVERLRKSKMELEKLVRARTLQIEEDTQIIQKQTVELQKLDKIKSRFFANVSHELRTPLTLMLGPISSALKKGDLNNRNFTLLKLAQINGQQLLKLVNSILNLSSLESGKLELKEETVTLYLLLRRILSQFESNAQIQGIEMIINYQPDAHLQIKLDISKFESILNNLLSNALKFTPNGGQIRVITEDLGHNIKITVSDTGRGIHLNDLPNVFDRFYQTKQASAVSEGGSGIGLALSKELAQLFGGALSVESELDKGSSFYFVFPKKEVLGFSDYEIENIENEDKSEISLDNVQASLQLQNSKNGNETTILLVEDNHSLRQYLSIILGDKYNLITAENGQEAWDMLCASQPSDPSKLSRDNIDLIISDIMMPVMDGYQLLEKLKSDRNWQYIPIIMLTARAELGDKLRALRIGVDDYLLKPFEEEELIVRIDNLLKHSKTRPLPFDDIKSKPKDSITNIPPPLTLEDREWLTKFETLIKGKVSDNSFSINDLPHEMATSRTQLFRRLKKLTGMTPNQYLREVRLQKARNFLENHTYSTVKEVCYAVGFQKPQYFSELFFKRFGKLPSNY